MKRMKKLVSVLLAVIMVLGMSMTVFAAQPPTDNTPIGDTKAGDEDNKFTLTIDEKTEGYTYEVYQIFIGDLDKKEDGTKTLSNIKWGQSINLEKVKEVFGGKTAEEVAEDLSNSATIFDAQEAKEFANKIAKCITGADTKANGDVVLPTGYQTAEWTTNAYVFKDLPAGYYMVANSAVPQADEENGTYAFTRYMLEIVGDVTAKPKGEVPTPEKKILDRQLACIEDHEHTEDCYSDKVDTNEASIGDEVEYEITGSMPSNIDDYTTYYYVFTDTLSKGLTLQKDTIKVTVNGKEATKYFYVHSSDYDEEKGTTIVVGIQDLKALSLPQDAKGNPIEVGDITFETEVVLTYTAKLNENAVIAGEGNPNDVKLTYSNDPNNSGDGNNPPPEEPDEPTPTHPTGESPKKKVVTYTTELTILKTDENNKFLPGVEFTLTGEGVNIVLVTEEKFDVAVGGEYWKLKDGTYTKTAPTEPEYGEDGEVSVPGNEDDYDSIEIKYAKTTSTVPKGNGKTETNVVGVVQADGTVTFKGLGAGSYTIAETKTLPGYNTIEDIEFNISFNATKTPMFETDNDTVKVNNANALDTKIENKRGSLLPSTGGIGTTIFTVVGAVLIIGAGILLVVKKRMSKN